MRRLAIFSIALLLAACGGSPEPVVPTAAVLETEIPPPTTPPTDAPALPTAPPTLTALAQRDTLPRQTGRRQVVAVAGPGSLDAPDLVPGDIYGFEFGSDNVYRLTVDAAADSDPVWSPEGERLFFVSDRTGVPYIYVVDVTNTNPVTRLADFPGGDQQHPTVSPDGLTIAFSSTRSGVSEIYKMSAIDGRAIEQVTTSLAADYQPSWSPDGTWIAFVSERDGNPEIYVMDTEGGNVLRLTDDPAADTQPAFSPDGRQIAFVSTRRGTPQVFVLGVPLVRASFNDTSESRAIRLGGTIPPANIDTSAPPPLAYPATSDPFEKSAPGWYVRMPDRTPRLTYAASLDGPNGAFMQSFSAASDGSNIDLLSAPLVSFGAPAVRP